MLYSTVRMQAFPSFPIFARAVMYVDILSKAVPYDAYGVQNIVLLYAESCMRVIFGPLRCVRVQIPVTFLFDFVREMICMHTDRGQIRVLLFC